MVKGLKTKDNIILNKVKNMKKEMSRLTLIFASLLISIAAWGVKVHPGPAVIKQSDGTEITVYAYGDCDNHWYATADGVLLYHEGFDYFVAKVDADGNLVPTKQLAHEMTQRSAAEVKLVKAQNRKLFYDKKKETSARLAPRKEPVENDNTLFFHAGSPKALVILAEFTDSVFKDSDPKSVFEQYLNADVIDNTVGNSTVGRNYGSVKKYFSDMSFGTFTPQFDIYGPYQMSQKLKYYGDGDKDHMERLIPELCQLADADIDFSQYDQNNDGKVDLVYIICASYSQSWTQNSSDCIWPKSGSAANYGKTDFGIYDGKGVYRFGVHTELNAYPGAFTQPYRINGVGLFCHEFSHCIGLPDIYPTDKAAQTALNPAMENWDLMDGGEYVYNGYYPTEYTAWEREAMGWFTIDTLKTTHKGSVTVSNINNGGKAYRIVNENSEGGKEYLILQYLENKGWNTRLPGLTKNSEGRNVQLQCNGMLVSHVEYDAAAFSLSSGTPSTLPNSVNNVIGHSRFTIIPADGEYISSYDNNNKDIYTLSMAGDPFPGTSNTTELLSIPWYTGEDISKPLLNITENTSSTNSGVTFDYIVPNDVFEEKEGFEVDSVFVNAVNGDGLQLENATVTTYANGDYLIEATDFSEAQISFANGIDVSKLDSLHLNVYSYEDMELKVELVLNEDSNNSNGIKRTDDGGSADEGTISVAAKEWTGIDLALEKLVSETADLTNLKGIRFSGGNGKTIFLNNIYFFGELPNAIVDIQNHPVEGEKIYTIDGIRLNQSRESLKKGIYIINGKKVIIM